MDHTSSHDELQATALFDQMQRIIEIRPTPLIESHHDDFYQIDRAILADKFSANARFLWLLHPCGTHLGRIGVLPEKADHMKAALNVYRPDTSPDKMELYCIETDAIGHARIQRIDANEGHRQIAQTGYTMEGDAMTKGGVKLALISTTVSRPQSMEYSGSARITAMTDDVLSREQLVAATMLAQAAVESLQDKFTRLKSILIDNHGANDLSKLTIPEVVQGHYAPAISQKAHEDDAPVEMPRERAAQF